MRGIEFTEGEYYHIYNRGTDKRNIFADKKDYERFIYYLFYCNDSNSLLNSQFYYRGLASIQNLKKDERKTILEVVCFCLMPNHFHLLLKQKTEKGIPLFMQKIGTGYTMYFNARHKRNGCLFQGTFKAKHITKDSYLTHLTRYIHLNPIEFVEPDWKNTAIIDRVKTHDYLLNYFWSSYSDYVGHSRFQNVLSCADIKNVNTNPDLYERFVTEWTGKDIKFIKDNTIEV